MKKNYLVLGLMTMILGLTACTKEAIDNAVAAPEQEQMITHTFSISDEAWDDEVRSSYTPGTGIQLTGTEEVTFYYSAAGDAYDASTPYTFKGYAKGTNSGDFQISVSHASVTDATAYDYYFMMPYLPSSKMNSKGAASYHRIGHVQYPSANSFDPNFDYLVGKPVLNVSATADSDDKIKGTNKIAGFKRITTPLHLTITDGEGALAEEKIQQVTLHFDAATDKNADKCLTGLFFYKHSENYDTCDFSGWEAGSLANAVTADYPAGLTKNSEGKWDVWFMVNPTTIPACNLTLTVVTDDHRYTRTVSTGKELAVVADKINTLSFNISGEGYTQSNVYTVDFSSITKIPTTITATNGLTYNWGLEGLTYNNASAPLPNSLRLKNTTNSGSITLPALEDGVMYKAIYISQNTNNTTKDAPIVVKSGDQEVAAGDFSYYKDVSASGGVLALTLTEPKAGPLTLTHTCSDALWITRITVETSGEIQEEPIDTNDYWALYNAGMDITVGNMTINNETHPGGKLICMDSYDGDEKIRTEMQKGGIYFLDTYTNEDGSPATDNVVDMTSHFKPGNNATGDAANTIVIGRYVDKQSNISLAEGKAFYVDCASGYIALKNIHLYSLVAANHLIVFSAGAEASLENLIIEDCSLEFFKNCFSYTSITSSSNVVTASAPYVVKNTYFRNSIFKMMGTGDNYTIAKLVKTGKKTSTDTAFDYTLINYSDIKTFEISNCVIYGTEDPVSGKRRQIIDYGSNSEGWLHPTSNLDVVFTNNTVYNATAFNNREIRAYQAKSISIKNNVLYADCTGDSASAGETAYVMQVYSATNNVGPNELNSNYAYAYGPEMTFTGWKWQTGSVVATNSNNKTKEKGSVENEIFTSAINVANGYFPVDTSKTNGSTGASYETKLWKQWE